MKQNQIFSIMKGVAIISVVIGHCVQSPSLELFVNQYHLAVFFFVAGYFFKIHYTQDFINYATKKVKRLYIPFTIAGLCFLIFHNLLYHLHINVEELSFHQTIKEIFILTTRMVSNEPMMGAMWFCPTLLIASLITLIGFKFSTYIHWKVPDYIKALPVFTTFLIISSVCLYVFHIKSPYCIWQCMIISGIMYEGFVFNKVLKTKKRIINRTYYWILLLLLLSILIILTYIGLYGRLQPSNISNENVLVIILIAGIGSIMVYSLSQIIINTKIGHFIGFCGDYSFSIMLLHFVCFKFVNLLQCWWYGYPFENINNFPYIKYYNHIWFVFYLSIGVIFPIILSKAYSNTKNLITQKTITR